MKGITAKQDTTYNGVYDRKRIVAALRKAITICLKKGLKFRYDPYLEELFIDGFRTTSTREAIYYLDTPNRAPVWVLLNELSLYKTPEAKAKKACRQYAKVKSKK